MAELIDMPKLSDTMTVGTIVSWLKKEGDPISPGDMIAEIETDKATMEMEVFTSGILLKQYVPAGGQVAVGETIAFIGEAGEAIPEAGSGKKQPKPANVKSETPASKPQPEAAPAEPQNTAQTAPTPAAPAEKPSSDQEALATEGQRIKASPLARKVAKEKGIPLEGLQGTGPGGRILRADVLNAKPSIAPATPKTSAAAPAPKASATPPSAPIAANAEDISIPVSNMRAVIATRLLESKTQIPHFYLQLESDVAPMLALRQTLNDKLGKLPAEQGGIKFSVNDFILKATVEALKQVPKANASWKGSSILQHGAIHLAFAVAVDDGLVTPTIKNAHQKSLRQISTEAKELIQKAQSKKLKPDEMSGSTFTVTNLGMFGITSFYGIINPPNAAILSVGATLRKPVVDDKNNIVPGDRMEIGLSGDHRVVDGAVGAAFLAALKNIIETPSLMLI
jgi:pyruvate dehydrogenase E2 component (dihydrolipoamide acetyltransferase)